jgi:hypothetical protein
VDAIQTLLVLVGGAAFGYGAAVATALIVKARARRMSAARISFDQAFPIIDEWAKRSCNEWYWNCREARHFAEDEFGRVMRDEPGLTVEQNLARVAAAVKQKYPAAFPTQH